MSHVFTVLYKSVSSIAINLKYVCSVFSRRNPNEGKFVKIVIRPTVNTVFYLKLFSRIQAFLKKKKIRFAYDFIKIIRTIKY